MKKLYKCKICKYKFKHSKISKEEEFKFKCPKCEHKGIVRHSNEWIWVIILIGIALGIAAAITIFIENNFYNI